ncbi:GerAB/ArcD/ProY family transporter [Paenibacillus protaetiae]|uniref:Spore gernimation protein n=1 Tax=Paenibacillus protaetiae TaxID=2509456 RepID=A0A4P6ETB1_9BACL|nr:endospore germination permease [Paenibacillus protaetiae]QAY65856.1 spore gernimation protein [Paenibacillus protaetiae]
MNAKELITSRQASIWFIMYQLGSAFLVLPATLSSYAQQDAWIAILFTLCIQVLIVLLHAGIASQLKGKSVAAHLEQLLGKQGGIWFVGLFATAYPFLIYSIVLRDLADFVANSIIPETPPEAIVALMIIAVNYIVRCGISTGGRAAEVLFSLVLLLFALGFFSLIPTTHLDNIKPVMENGWKPIVHASILTIGFPYAESVIFLFIAHHFKEPDKWKSAVMKASMMSGAMFLFMTFVCIAVLSEGVVENLSYPTYFAVRTISIADFYERFEVVVAVLWYIAIFFRLALLLYVISASYASLFRIKSNKPLLLPISLIGFVVSTIVWPNTAVTVRSLEEWPYYSMFFGLVIPIVLWTIGKMKDRNASS